MHLSATLIRVSCGLAAIALLACTPGPAPITGREWRVASINEMVNPVGSGGRLLHLTLDDSTKRVYGYAGCNQFNAAYTLSGDSLSFGPAFASRMSCADADSLEFIFMQALLQVRQYSRTDSLLVLTGAGTSIRLR